MSQKKYVLLKVSLLVVTLVVCFCVILFEGSVQRFLFPMEEKVFDPIADSTDWQTYEIPEINMSFKLPPNTKVYTRESIAKGNVENDDNFEWAVGRFETSETHFVATNFEYSFNIIVATFSRNYSIFRNSYSKFTSKQFSKMISSNYDYGSLKSYYFKSNNNIFVYDFKISDEYMGAKHFYDTLIKNKRNLFAFLYNTETLTVEQQSIQNAIIKSIFSI